MPKKFDFKHSYLVSIFMANRLFRKTSAATWIAQNTTSTEITIPRLPALASLRCTLQVNLAGLKTNPSRKQLLCVMVSGLILAQTELRVSPVVGVTALCWTYLDVYLTNSPTTLTRPAVAMPSMDSSLLTLTIISTILGP
jgi:hypothetical protein